MSEQSKNIEIVMDDIIVFVHNEIAEWHNDNPTADSLRVASYAIAEGVLNMAFSHIGKTSVGINKEAAKEAVKKHQENKAQKEKKSKTKKIMDKII